MSIGDHEKLSGACARRGSRAPFGLRPQRLNSQALQSKPNPQQDTRNSRITEYALNPNPQSSRPTTNPKARNPGPKSHSPKTGKRQPCQNLEPENGKPGDVHLGWLGTSMASGMRPGRFRVGGGLPRREPVELSAVQVCKATKVGRLPSTKTFQIVYLDVQRLSWFQCFI